MILFMVPRRSDESRFKNMLETISIIIFLCYLYLARRQGDIALLLYAGLFAFLFEAFSIFLFAGQAGGYFYSDVFRVIISGVPLAIPLVWAAIIYSAHHIALACAGRRAYFFVAPLLILLLDLVFDQVATRLGLWIWIGFEAKTGVFAVPASNYIGWLLLPALFYLVWDRLKDRPLRPLVLVLPYLAFIAISLPLHLLKVNFFDDNDYAQYAILATMVAIFIALSLTRFEKTQDKAAPFLALWTVRIILHLASLAGVIYLGSGSLAFLVLFFLIMLEILAYRLAKKARI